MRTESLTTTPGPDATSLTNAILAALAPSKEELPMPVPLGELGRCAACGYTVVSHLQAVGTTVRFIGCLKGAADTVFVLVPVTRATTRPTPAAPPPATTLGTTAPTRHETKRQRTSAPVAAAANDMARTLAEVNEATPATPARGFKRARYFSAVDRRRNLAKLDISPVRRKVLETVHKAGDKGILARQIIKRAGLPHGSVQQTLNWLRAHEQVQAVEDGTTPHALAS